ncbi:MAG: hypothetical protein ABR511_01470 [Acidimicrobiales bacterium]
MTIERTWVRVLLSSPWRILVLGIVLFALVVAVPLVLVLVGVYLVGLVVLCVGVCAVAALVFALYPGRRR